jgi:hypothetical protein
VLVSQGWSGPEHIQATAALATSASAVTAMAQEPSIDDRDLAGWTARRLPNPTRAKHIHPAPQRFSRSANHGMVACTWKDRGHGWQGAHGAVGNHQVTKGSDLGGEAQLADATSPPGGGPPPAAAVCHVADGGRPPATRPCSVSSICLGLPSVGANPSPGGGRRARSGGGWQGSPGGQPAAAPRQGQVGLHVPPGADG